MRAIVFRTTHLVVLVVWLAIHHPVSFAQAETTLFVSPRGNDSWSGRVAVSAEDGSDGPLASLLKAV